MWLLAIILDTRTLNYWKKQRTKAEKIKSPRKECTVCGSPKATYGDMILFHIFGRIISHTCIYQGVTYKLNSILVSGILPWYPASKGEYNNFILDKRCHYTFPLPTLSMGVLSVGFSSLGSAWRLWWKKKSFAPPSSQTSLPKMVRINTILH